jgi:C1A family cysteine protease
MMADVKVPLDLPISSAGRRYGRKRDFYDPRDLILTKKQIPKRAVRLPQSVDLTEFCGPIKDQKAEGSCTGHAYSSILEFLCRKYKKTSPIFSPQFLYAQELLEENNFPNDEGAQSKTGCVILSKYGCCEESAYPYKVGNITKPTEEQLANATKWKGGAYHRIPDVPNMLGCLASGYPFSVGFNVYGSFEGKWAVPGMMPIPNQDTDLLLGGHEVFACGYDQKKKAVLIQNSWGESWGLGGRFWMPFQILQDGNLVSDVWIFHSGKPWGK